MKIAPLLSILLLILIEGCSGGGSEDQRVSNPDKSLDAVIYSRHTGATDATPIELHIVEFGAQEISESQSTLVASGYDVGPLRWLNANEVLLELRCDGEIYKYSNRAYVRVSASNLRKVRIKMSISDSCPAIK